VPGQASGKDLGVHGKLYEIREEDMLSYVQRKAAEISMAALRESMVRKLEESYARHSLVSLDVPSATEERVRYVDPSVNVRNPLYDHTGAMIFPAGVVNPLDHVPLSKSILMLREDQVKRVLEETDKRGEKPILLLTDGDIRKASSLAGRMVYRANPLMLRRLQIEKVPSLVTQEGRKLKVEEMVLR
jgi:conjugal transfer pilus assembly protein TraW